MRRAFYCLIFIAQAAGAGSFEVAPTTISLPSQARAGALYVVNSGTQAVAVQIEPFDWQQTEAGEALTDSNSLMISPPMVRLAPGQKQTVRLAMNPQAHPLRERAYRLMVSEIPDGVRSNNGVRVLLQFSVPVFVAPAAAAAPTLEWSAAQGADGLTLRVRNSGAQHAKLSRLVVSAGGQDIAVAPNQFDYVLAGAEHAWSVKAHAAPGQMLDVKAEDAQEGMVHAAVRVAP